MTKVTNKQTKTKKNTGENTVSSTSSTKKTGHVNEWN